MDIQIHQLSQAEQLHGGAADGDPAHAGSGHVVLHGVASLGQCQRGATNLLPGNCSCTYVDDVPLAGK